MISWWLMGLPAQADLYLFDVLALFTTIVTGFCFSQLVSVSVPDPMAGQVTGSAIFSIMFLTSGYFIPKSQIPDWWIWLYYLSLFHWAFNPMIINAFTGLSYGSTTHQDIVDTYDVNGESKWLGIGVLLLFIIVMRYAFYRQLVTNFSGQRKS